MYQLVVDLKDFSAAHRLVKNYHGKCNHLHGHNYALRVRVATESLDENDLVLDFSVVRKVCDAWVQGALDHATLVFDQDTELLTFVTETHQKYFVLRHNSTVECLASLIFQHLAPLIAEVAGQQHAAFHLAEVELWESRHCGVVFAPGKLSHAGVTCGH